MIFYFYDTSMTFVFILHKEEKINIHKARVLFGLVSLILVCGKFDYYFIQTAIQYVNVFDQG